MWRWIDYFLLHMPRWIFFLVVVGAIAAELAVYFLR